VSSAGFRLGVAGALLGIVAGIVQWAAGSDIREWSGNKLHPVQLGIITVALSLIALACVSHLARADGDRWQRALAGLGIVAAAGICFTTVGRLWYVPGPLLLLSACLLLLRAPRVDERPQPEWAGVPDPYVPSPRSPQKPLFR
jgi:hypothetical protein